MPRIHDASGKLLDARPVRPKPRESTEDRLRRLGFAEVSPEQRERNLNENLDWFLGGVGGTDA